MAYKLETKYIRQIRAIMAKQGIDEELKQELVSDLTNGRTTSISKLFGHEAISLIRNLNGDADQWKAEDTKANKLRRSILAIAHQLGWETDEGKVDMARVNGFCEARGFGKKPLNDYTVKELPKLIAQFKAFQNNTTKS